MDASAARWVAASSDPNAVSGLLKGASDPIKARAVAKQFGALLMQSLLQQNDGSGMQMVDGAGGGVVNSMFASTMGRVAMSGEKLGLTDLLLHSIQQKQQGAAGTPAGSQSPLSLPSAGHETPAAAGLPLAAYWQAGGHRPLANAAGAVALSLAASAAGAGLPLDARTVALLAQSALRPAAPAAAPSAAAPAAAAGGAAAGPPPPADIAGFIREVGPLVQQAAQQLGVSPRILLAQAAIETGWGRSVVGNNLFGIKAGSSWTGAAVSANTHEYEGGQLVAIRDNFRAYPSYAASVQDFVALVKNSHRYQAALGSGEDAGAYARALLAGGWATDIDYAGKLQAVAGSRHATSAFLPVSAPAPAAAVPTTVPL